MKNSSILRILLTSSLLLFIFTTDLNAQAGLMTWMSGLGTDANSGNRTAPVLTLNGALTRSNAGGQISAVDAGDFRNGLAINITKAITIDCTAIPAEILVPTATTGVTIAAGASDVVILRHLAIDGNDLGTTGIQFNSGGLLIIEDCTISGFTNAALVISSATGSVVIKNTSITNTPTGISVTTPINVSLSNVLIDGATTGIDARAGVVNLTHSVISQNSGIGVLADGTSTVSSANTFFSDNAIAVQSNTGATLRLTNNDFYNNTTAIGNNGGVVATANNNRDAGSTIPGAPTTSIIIR